MILIAESGSTKTKWLTGKKELHQTIGFNPLFHSSEFIYQELMKNEQLRKDSFSYSKVYFYGASCSSPDRKKTVHDALKKFFPKADLIEVDHDLRAAALATYDGRTCITCILGTGSNSCLFDGVELKEVYPALGYVLGDEGGGAYFGKKLLSKFIYHELPEATTSILRGKYELDKEKIFENVYQKPHANVYLSGFAKVMNDTPDVAFMDQLAEEGFTEFFSHHVSCYENYQKYPVHFVGSIAFHFKHVLKKVAGKFGCELGVVDRNPVYSLLEWHLKNEG